MCFSLSEYATLHPPKRLSWATYTEIDIVLFIVLSYNSIVDVNYCQKCQRLFTQPSTMVVNSMREHFYCLELKYISHIRQLHISAFHAQTLAIAKLWQLNETGLSKGVQQTMDSTAGAHWAHNLFTHSSWKSKSMLLG